eukprot:7482111-Prorocentrum_lima.AAC.1
MAAIQLIKRWAEKNNDMAFYTTYEELYTDWDKAQAKLQSHRETDQACMSTRQRRYLDQCLGLAGGSRCSD